MTTPDTAVDVVLDVIARHRRGEELPGRVDRMCGYEIRSTVRQYREMSPSLVVQLWGEGRSG